MKKYIKENVLALIVYMHLSSTVMLIWLLFELQPSSIAGSGRRFYNQFIFLAYVHTALLLCSLPFAKKPRHYAVLAHMLIIYLQSFFYVLAN